MTNRHQVNIYHKEKRIQARVASNYLSRLRGLIGSRPLRPSEGLLMVPCNFVHTFGLQYAIDVVFLSPDFKIIKIITYCRPLKFFKHRQAKYVLELFAGQASVHDFKVGTKLRLSATK